MDATGIARKAEVVTRGLAFHADAPATAFETLRRLGGREIAAIAGAVLAARHRRIPVLLDGFLCCSAMAPLAVANPAITAPCLAGHCPSSDAPFVGHCCVRTFRSWWSPYY